MKKFLLLILLCFTFQFNYSQESYTINGETLELKTEIEGQIDLLWTIINREYRYFVRTDNGAITELKKVIAIDPNDADAHCNLGVAYLEKGMWDETIIECKKAISIVPNFAEAHYHLGVTYGNKEMLDEEIMQYKKAISINSNNAEAHYNLGIAYAKKDMPDKAIMIPEILK